jgi:DNA-binding transcriptional MerR regulator
MRKKRMKDYRQAQLARIDIISGLYKRGYSFREIRSEVMKRLDLETYSLETVHKDITRMLEEWREQRIDRIDQVVQLELQRNDDIIKEAWQAWDKSKTDYERKSAKQQGLPTRTDDKNEGGISTTKIEQSKELVIRYGDPRYLDLILKVQERNAKLLGYDSPIKVDVYNTPPKDEAPASADYDLTVLPPEMLVEMAMKLQDSAFNKNKAEDGNDLTK